MKLKHFAKTDIGLKRKANEDSIGELLFNKSKYGNIYIVCDGMGGHEGGKMASETAINSIIEYFSNTPSDSPTTALKEAIEFANIQIFGKAQSDSQYKGMGTTCCVLLEKNNLIYVAHVGDSRIYISSDGKFHRVTKDHSFVQGLFDNGQISEEEMETHARKNELTQALGVSTEVNVEVCSDPILAKKGDNFLICSDGLCGLIDDNKIYDIVNKGKTNSDIGNNLIDAANNAGGTDNISVIYISIDESPHAKSQFISKNNIPKDNLTKTMLLDTDQKAAILAKNNFSFFNKYKNKIFISVGVLFMTLLMILIIPKIGNNDVPEIEIETIDKTTDLELNVDEFEAQIEIDGEEVEIFYYSFKKSNDWTKENKNFKPLFTNVKLTHKWDNKNDVNFQEFYWNNNFLLYDEYKTQKEILYDSDISENSFIFIRKSNLEKIPNSKPKVDSDPFQLKEEEKKKKKAEAARKAKAKKEEAAKKKAAAAAKNKEAEIIKLDEDHKKLKSFISKISDLKVKIKNLNINDNGIAKLFENANTNYENQKTKFFEVYKGYSDIPNVLPTTNIPKGILELNKELFTKGNDLDRIKKSASKDYKKAEKIQKDAASHLNSSKQNFKLAEDFKNKLKVIHNTDNKELKDRCENDLESIVRASKNIKIITNKSDEISAEFKSITEYLDKINNLSKKSEALRKLIEENVNSKLEKKRR